MAKDDELSAAKRSYRSTVAEGNRQEEARWANVIGDILKNRGEYVEALKWVRKDYDVSVKYLPDKQLLPTCQSLGELYLRLEFFKDALIYQKKHLDLAKETGDLVEQQRASTQLGRTYHEMFLRSNDDHYSVRNAKKYFNLAMKLAESLKEHPQTNKSTFLKEYIDAHNNIGMLQKDLDNLEESQKILNRGLEICDEEEVAELDDGRSRLHHNLGNVFMELRKWDKAQEHIKKDIVICRKIQHFQGEAKGYINLGELHYRVQKYDQAIFCYKKALDLARSMEDENALVDQIQENIKTVQAAMKVLDELKQEEQNLKKLTRNLNMARGTSGERKCLLQLDASLDRLVEKSSIIFAWVKHRDFAKRKKRTASELYDQEKLGDSFLVIGESYQKLRNFNKALKWYTKSWETYNAIGNLEGQALAKINVGDVLDSSGNWAGALDAFEEGYRIACNAKIPSAQLSALENMHYSNMIRFDNVEEARRLQSLINKLKRSVECESKIMGNDCCSETDTEGDTKVSDGSDVNYSPERTNHSFMKSNPCSVAEDLIDDSPSNSHICPTVNLLKRSGCISKPATTREPTETSFRSTLRSTGSQGIGHKRVRVVESDNEGENEDVWCSRRKFHSSPAEDIATSGECGFFTNFSRYDLTSTHGSQDVSPVASKSAISANTPVNHDESTCSYRSRGSKLAAEDDKEFRSSSSNRVDNTSNVKIAATKCDADFSQNLFHKHKASDTCSHGFDEERCEHVTFKIEEDFVSVKLSPFTIGDKLSIANLKVEVACKYYLQLPKEKRTKGLLPIVQHLKCSGRILQSLESLNTFKDYLCGKGWIDVSIDGWVPKRLMKLYIDCCLELSEPPNLSLLKKLYNIDVSEDEIIVSGCELQDMSVAPLLNALHLHKTVAVLDLSHNLLGNETMEKLQQLFTSSSQKYGGLILDLHHNRFGPTSLFQICECPVLFARLEVLNISANRLTDSCGSYLAKILRNCKALYSLNVEHCSITSRTVQKIADSLDSESVLAQLCLGHNHPVTGNAVVNLLAKLATLDRFSELNLNGIKLNKAVVDGLCRLAKTSCLSELMLGSTCIGTDGALQLMESLSSETRELVKLDLSSCGLTSHYFVRLNAETSLINGIMELSLGENPIMQEGGNALASLLKNPRCSLKILVLYKCQLGLVGLLRVLESLAENSTLEELNLAGNSCMDESDSLHHTLVTSKYNSSSLQKDQNVTNSSSKASAYENTDATSLECNGVNTDCNDLEVADSDDDQVSIKPLVSGINSCTSLSHRDKNHSNLEREFIQELVSSISKAKQLQVLDLSDNGFSEQVAETLYGAWSSSSRTSSAERHIYGDLIHFNVQGRDCCVLKPCCRRI